ncbi:MAG: helix-turn-helix domain-containing protein [Pirellulaceae bacterium]
MSGSHEPIFEQPAAQVIPLADFDEVGALFSNWQGRFEQISSGRFEGVLRVVQGGLVRTIEIKANQRLSLRGHDASDMFSIFPVTAGNCGSLWEGRRLSPGHLVLDDADGEANHFTARRTVYQGAFVHTDTLLEAARSLLATDAVALPRHWTAHSPPPESFARLCQHIASLLNQGVTDPTLLGTPEGDRLEQECVRAIIAAMFAAATPQPDLPLAARSHMFRRAEEFMRAHLSDPVGAIDLCRELGVSDRNLRRTFRERVGLGPMAYFKYLRLNAVRSRLRADPAAVIADAAGALGFHHAGNFAADYRRLFRELPSDTLRGAWGRRLPPSTDVSCSS